MSDRDDADGLVVLGELVDDAVGACAQGAEPAEPASQRVSGVRLALRGTQAANNEASLVALHRQVYSEQRAAPARLIA